MNDTNDDDYDDDDDDDDDNDDDNDDDDDDDEDDDDVDIDNHEVMMMTALMLVMMMMSIMVLEMFHKNCCRTCRQNSVSSSLPFLLHCFFYTTELFLLRCRLKAHLLLFKLRVVKFASTNSLLE